MSQLDPTCAFCSEPIGSGSPIVFERGAFLHLRCRGRAAASGDIEGPRPAEAGLVRPAGVLGSRSPRPCPLCGYAATVTDWRPSHLDWLVVEGCGCGDFFVSAALFEGRLPRLSAEERQTLSTRIRWFRAKGVEAWCTTTADGTGDGRLDIREVRESFA
jgi:hypothetical protein